MAFSQSEISWVNVQAEGPELFISWAATSPQGTVFQVYVDSRLSWSGTSRSCHVPVPAGDAGGNIWVDVGTVAPGEEYQPFSTSLASLSQGGARPQISWPGGTYLDPTGGDDLQGFHIYRSAAPGGLVDRTAPIDAVPAYPGGWVCDGFGLGGFGLGGFGRAASAYSWTSGGLASGVWQFAVVPFDLAGNDRGSGQTVSVTVSAAPLPPSPAADGSRLTYTYSGPTTRQATISWLASPSS